MSETTASYVPGSGKRRKKGGRKSLARGKPRLLGRQNGAEGRAYHAAYVALEESCGPFTSKLLRFEAGRTAVTMVNLEAATRALTAARRERERGKGRRPSAQAIERLSRGQGLADTSYAQAVARLEALAGRNGHGKVPALTEYLAQQYGKRDG